MRIAIVFHSAGGNTKALADTISAELNGNQVDVFRMRDFDVSCLARYDGLVVGTYTWGDGDLPARAKSFFANLEESDLSHLVTAVFGTGETNYRAYCGAVDRFAELLYMRSLLAVTLKVEQMYQPSDLERIKKFCTIFESNLGQP